jgi:hypothetical protein
MYTMEPVSSDHQEVRVQISVGDTVRVLTKDSERRVLKIVSLDEHAMTGEKIRIPYEDIVFLERRTFSSGRTAAVSATGAGALTTVWLLITSGGAVFSL